MVPRPDVPEIGTAASAPAPHASLPPPVGPPADLLTERVKVRTFAARRRHFVELLHERTRRYEAEGRRVLAWPFYAARVLAQVVKQWLADRCPQQASALAYTTALSI